MKKNIVLIGGGHGLSSLLESLKGLSDLDVSAIVTTTDSGGHTGKIRNEFLVPALGDIRRNFASTINDQFLKKMLEYRFEKIHGINDVSLGNLMLLALIKDYDLESLMYRLHKHYHTSALLIPSCNYSNDLVAIYEDNTIQEKENLIPNSNKKIKDIYYSQEIKISNRMSKIINDADYIIFAPGSLYTSVGAVISIKEIADSIRKSKATLIYVSNIMSEPGETDGYDILDHLEFIESKIMKLVDLIIANNGKIEEKLLNKYQLKNSFPVSKNEDKRIKYYNLIDNKLEYIRHDPIKLKKIFQKILKSD